MVAHKGERYFLLIGVLCVAIVAVVSVREQGGVRAPDAGAAVEISRRVVRAGRSRQAMLGFREWNVPVVHQRKREHLFRTLRWSGPECCERGPVGVCAGNIEFGWNEDQLVERDLLGAMFGRRRWRRS